MKDIQAKKVISSDNQLTEMGLLIRTHRKSMKITAAAASEAAGISRVTLFRIEKGQPSVNMGAYLNVLSVLNLQCNITGINDGTAITKGYKEGWLPARISLNDYPQLKELAWHIRGVDELSPTEAHGIYQRNGRFLENDKLSEKERDLIEALNTALDGIKT